jgi:hypothetical protein
MPSAFFGKQVCDRAVARDFPAQQLEAANVRARIIGGVVGHNQYASGHRLPPEASPTATYAGARNAHASTQRGYGILSVSKGVLRYPK